MFYLALRDIPIVLSTEEPAPWVESEARPPCRVVLALSVGLAYFVHHFIVVLEDPAQMMARESSPAQVHHLDVCCLRDTSGALFERQGGHFELFWNRLRDGINSDKAWWSEYKWFHGGCFGRYQHWSMTNTISYASRAQRSALAADQWQRVRCFHSLETV